MIACRSSSSGVHLVWRVTRAAHVLSNSPGCFQVCVQNCHVSHFRKMNGSKDGSAAMDQHKKRKTVTSLWVPVSTRYIPKEGHSVMTTDGRNPCVTMNHDIKSVTKLQVRSVHGQPSLTSNATDRTHGPETMDNPVCPSISSKKYLDSSSQPVVLASDFTTVGAIGQEQSKQDDCEILGSELDAGLMDEVERHSVSIEGQALSCRWRLILRQQSQFPVDASLLRFVKGKGGTTQRRIEEEEGVKIIMPSSREETCVVIEGSSIENVNKAADKINGVLEEAIRSPLLDYSHFVSLPLAIHPELVERLNNFQNSILRVSSQDGNNNIDSNADALDNGNGKDSQLEDVDVAVKLEVKDDKEHVKVDIVSTSKKSSTQLASVLSDLGIDRSIFIKPRTFHLTVLMLKLWNKERVAVATEVLQKVYPKMLEALENRPISIRLKGLECMKGSPAKARVLYAPVEEIGGRASDACMSEVIIEAYVEAGLVLEKDAQQSLKLHATLMNARHRKRKMKHGRHDSFDARCIFKRYGSEDWGEYLIQEVHLSQRFVFGEGGYYHCCASIPCPGNMKIN